jgi:hypothetical protein
VITALLDADTTRTALRRRTKLASQTLDHTLETLAQAGIVERLPGSQGAWHVTHWPETLALLLSARRLAVALAGSDDHAAGLEQEMLARLEEAGSARPAARRGAPPGNDEP